MTKPNTMDDLKSVIINALSAFDLSSEDLDKYNKQTFWNIVERAITAKLKEVDRAARIEAVSNVLQYLDVNQNLDKYEIEGMGVPVGGGNFYHIEQLLKDADKYKVSLKGGDV